MEPLVPEQTRWELTQLQLDGMRTFHERRRARLASVELAARTREQRLDAARVLHSLREQQRALVAQAAARLADGADLLDRFDRPRIVVAHRQDWFVARLRSALGATAWQWVARPSNGAEAVGVVVAEQPDVVFLEDRLPLLTGCAVICEIVACAPRSLVAVQVADDRDLGAVLDAGAQAVYARRMPPADVARSLDELVAAGRSGR